jgi:hypothetical protein
MDKDMKNIKDLSKEDLIRVIAEISYHTESVYLFQVASHLGHHGDEAVEISKTLKSLGSQAKIFCKENGWLWENKSLDKFKKK